MSTQSKTPFARLEQPPLNRLPKGLMDFLGIKSGAWGPRILGQQLGPSIELLDWYTEMYAQWFNVATVGGHAAQAPGALLPFAGATSDPTVINALGQLMVPADEAWYVHEFAAMYSFPALENGSFNLQLITQGNATSTLVPPQTVMGQGTMAFATGAPAAGGRFVTALQRKMFWQPGTVCSIESNGTTALAGVIRGVGRVSRFKV